MPFNIAILTTIASDGVYPEANVVQESSLKECMSAYEKDDVGIRIDDFATSADSKRHQDGLEALAALAKIEPIESALDWALQTAFQMGRRFGNKETGKVIVSADS